MRKTLFGMFAATALSFVGSAHADPDWKAVGAALGKDGVVQPGGVHRVGLPRSDLKVVLDGVELKPTFALGSWLAFKGVGGSEVMVMGDLVLTDEEVNPVMKRLAEGGVEVTALHNHLLRSSPHTMYLHVHGHGDAVKLATTLHDALGQSKTPFGGPTSASSQPSAPAAAPDQQLALDPARIDQVLGRKGKVNGACIRSVCRVLRRPATTARRCPRAWDRPSPSTSSRPAPARS